MGPNETERATIFPNSTRSRLLPTWSTLSLGFTWHYFSLGFGRCRIYNLSTCGSFERANNHCSKAKKRTAESFQYLVIKFGRYRCSSRKFKYTVIYRGWTVSYSSSTGWPLHLRVGLCSHIVHGLSHDLFVFPSDNDCLGKVRGHSKMDWLQSDGD